MIHFGDATWAPYLDATQAHGVYYKDGKYANEAAVRARLPHATLLSITVFGMLSADVADCERGNITPAETVAWVGKKVAAGHNMIVVYADMDYWQHQGLLRGLAHYGNRIKRWVASYDGVAEVPAGFDAKQYQTNTKVDLNVALDSFFTPWSPPNPEKNSGIANFEGSVNLATGSWTIRSAPGLNVVFAGKPELWHSKLSLRVGDGGGAWSVTSQPGSPVVAEKP